MNLSSIRRLMPILAVALAISPAFATAAKNNLRRLAVTADRHTTNYPWTGPTRRVVGALAKPPGCRSIHLTSPNKLTAVSLMSALALAVVASGAIAAPAEVSVTLGPALREKAEDHAAIDEVRWLADDLRVSVERALALSGRYPDTQVYLVLTDAWPNNPVFKKRGRLDLSAWGWSVSLGGAAIEGRIIGPDGTETAVAYNWYQQGIAQTPLSRPWADARETFDRFGKRLVRGKNLKKR